jgi:hypothetical protein
MQLPAAALSAFPSANEAPFAPLPLVSQSARGAKPAPLPRVQPPLSARAPPKEVEMSGASSSGLSNGAASANAHRRASTTANGAVGSDLDWPIHERGQSGSTLSQSTSTGTGPASYPQSSTSPTPSYSVGTPLLSDDAPGGSLYMQVSVHRMQIPA